LGRVHREPVALRRLSSIARNRRRHAPLDVPSFRCGHERVGLIRATILQWGGTELGNTRSIACVRCLSICFHAATKHSRHPNLRSLGQNMAQKSTIYKVELSVSDMDRHYYETHKLTVAKHPSETDERLMVRIVAFALNAHELLEMTKGLSTDDEPDIWQKSLSGELDVWVALGLPSEKVIRQSCGKAAKVVIYPYGGRTAEMWWEKVKNSTTRFDNLRVMNFYETDTDALAKLASRTMKLQVNIQDGDVMVSVGDSIVYVYPVEWKSAA